ncbi:MAG: short-chain dehydrogenase-like protein [Monoraphidium minutum]|nr:MAG: short-chain dehydrogenase-like protein [Monoraphidium minutum]
MLLRAIRRAPCLAGGWGGAAPRRAGTGSAGVAGAARPEPQRRRHSTTTRAASNRGGASGADLAGQVFLVTGSTDGIGRHTALRLAAAGATVLVHGRDAGRVAAAAAAARDAAARAPGGGGGAEGRVQSFQADLADLKQVRRLAAAVRAAHPGGIHTLINNAGVYSERLVKSADGFEVTWAVNVLAPFLLTALLIDKVQAHVITTSSISASSHLDEGNLQQERGYSAHSAYSASKLCNQVFTLRLARMLCDAGSPVLANTLDPGTVNTKMLLAGWGRIGIEVGDANNTWSLAAAPGGESGAYRVGGRAARPVPAAADAGLQERLWALWEEQAGERFRL